MNALAAVVVGMAGAVAAHQGQAWAALFLGMGAGVQLAEAIKRMRMR